MENNLIENVLKSYKTPLYVFDSRVLAERVKYLRSHLPKGIKICYAIKANTFVVGAADSLVERFEVCSPGEIGICREQKVESKKLVISGVYKSEEVIEELVRSGDDVGFYTAESLSQFRLLVHLSQKYNKSLNVMLRLTSGNQFGMDKKEITEIIKRSADYSKINISSLQYFSGTQKTSLKRLKRELTHLDEFMKEIYESYGFSFKELEFGAGFPVAYFSSDEFDEEQYLSEFSDILKSIDFKCELTLELGRSIAASCGTYLTSVVDIKTNKNQNYAIVDGGMNHIVYFGQSMAMKHPYYSLYPDRQTGETLNWNLCGSLCTANDILVKGLPVRGLRRGDVVCFKNTGAYCMTEGISLFLSRDLPCVLAVDRSGQIRCVREAVSTYKLNTFSL